MISDSGYLFRISRYRPRLAENPKPIGSSTGSSLYGTANESSRAIVSSKCLSVDGSSGTTTTSHPQSPAASTFLELTDRTRDAPARVAAATSPGSKLSTDTRIPS